MSKFLDPGLLRDDDLELRLLQKPDGDYRFGMYVQPRLHPVGTIELRLGGSEMVNHYGGQVGYGVAVAFQGHNFAARSLKLIAPLARRHGLERLWITCDVENFASSRSCELAGAVLEEIVDLPIGHEMYARGERQKCRYRLELADY